MKRSIKLLALLVSASVCLQASASIITVMNTNDSGAGSLRQALADANNGDTVTFDFSLHGQTITLYNGELLVNKSVTINGPGANDLTVRANGVGRVFHVTGGVTAIIARLAITNVNRAGGGTGGGIHNSRSMLTVSNCNIHHNSASSGGGIYNDGSGGSATLSVLNSTLSDNQASALGGGGIYNIAGAGSATLSVLNSTFSENVALGGSALGGAIWAEGDVSLSVLNSTFSDNVAAFGGGIAAVGAEGSIGSTIFNASSLSVGPSDVVSIGYNLSSEYDGFFHSHGDRMNTNPLLGPVQNNGGPTLTYALLPGSPAIDAGNPNFAPPPDYDQRGPGFDRVVNGRIDIGSFEVQATPRP